MIRVMKKRFEPKTGLRGYRVRQMVGEQAGERQGPDDGLVWVRTEHLESGAVKIGQVEYAPREIVRRAMRAAADEHRAAEEGWRDTVVDVADIAQRVKVNGRYIWAEPCPAARLAPPVRPRPSLRTLGNCADALPLGPRKRVKAMAGDYDAEIQAFHAAGRYRMAQWNRMLAWLCAGWYLLRSPLDAAATWAVKAIKGP